MNIVTAQQMMDIDRKCIESGMPGSVLMENAGKAVAEAIIRTSGDVTGKKVVVLAGPGNNGGDGLVVARYLHDWNANVIVYLFGKKRKNDVNLGLVQERNILCIEVNENCDLEGLHEASSNADIVVDSLFGTGNNRPLGGLYKTALEIIGEVVRAKNDIHVYAVDLPSGLNADTGEVDEACLFVDDTITLAAPKIGLFQFPGMERAGRVTIVDIGIQDYLFEGSTLELNTAEKVRYLLPRRPVVANKGTFGKVLVIAGSVNYIGAAYLACAGAIRSGAGLVTLATAKSLQPIVAAKLAEVTYLPLPESEFGIISPQAIGTIVNEIDKYDVLLIGCGLGQSMPVQDFLKTLLLKKGKELPLTVLDADALNILSDVPEWWKEMTGNVILTPHPGEMARLTGLRVNDIQRNRLKVAEDSAEKWNKTVVLKGAYTVIASPCVPAVINPAVNSGLASAGTGDVLAGVISGIAAQGLGPAEAALCGVYLHGEAGETVKEKIGDTGMTASDLLPELPKTIKRIKDTTSG